MNFNCKNIKKIQKIIIISLSCINSIYASTINIEKNINIENGKIEYKILNHNNNKLDNINNQGIVFMLDNFNNIININNKGTFYYIRSFGNIKNVYNYKKINTIINHYIKEGTIENLYNYNYINYIFNGGDIQNIYNNGTINIIKNDLAGTITINNYGTINSLENLKLNITHEEPYILINNHGNINNIINEGTMIIKHDLKNIVYKLKEYNTPLKINNRNNGNLLIDGYYFNKAEFNKKEQKQNSIKLSGNNINGINIKNIVLNDKDVIKNKIYDSSTFFEYTDKTIPKIINKGKGVDANEIISLTGIYKYENVGIDKYKVKEVNKNELSGESLMRSLVNSSRLRYINISNIIDDITYKNFKTDNHNLNTLNLIENTFIQGEHQSDNHSFFLPYYTKSNINLYNSLKLSAKTNGFIAGSQRQLPKGYGIISFYLGYENSKQERNDKKLNLKNDTYHSGLSYYSILGKNDIHHYYLKTNINFDYTLSNLEKSYDTTTELTNTKAKSFAYGADILFGGNYYEKKHNFKLNPELGISYKGISFNDFNLLHVGGLNEHYLSQQINFIDSVAAMKLQIYLNEKVKTNLKFGALYNIHNDAKEKLKLGNNQLIINDIIFSKWYTFTQIGLSYIINNNMDISLNYNGIFTFKETQAHTAFLKMSLWW